MTALDVERLEALRALQSRFLAAVRAGDWMEAQSLQARRSLLIDALLGEPPLAEEVVGELRAVVAAERAALPALEAARARCADELRQLSHARKALSAYHSA